MDIQTRKIEFVQEFLKLQSEEVVALFETMLQSETKGRFQPKEYQDKISKEIAYWKKPENQKKERIKAAKQRLENAKSKKELIEIKKQLMLKGRKIFPF